MSEVVSIHNIKQLLERQLTQWLCIQCQMVDPDASGVLLRFTATNTSMVEASYRFPNLKNKVEKNKLFNDSILPDVMELGGEVLKKKRMSMRKVYDDKTLMAHPVDRAGELWGALILLVDNFDPQKATQTTKKVKLGVTWFPYIDDDIVQLPDPEPELDTNSEISDENGHLELEVLTEDDTLVEKRHDEDQQPAPEADAAQVTDQAISDIASAVAEKIEGESSAEPQAQVEAIDPLDTKTGHESQEVVEEDASQRATEKNASQEAIDEPERQEEPTDSEAKAGGEDGAGNAVQTAQDNALSTDEKALSDQNQQQTLATVTNTPSEEDQRFIDTIPESMDDLSLLKLALGEKLLSEKTVDEQAITIVNVLATAFRLSRVSVGLVKKQGVELLAVSHSASFDARSEPMQHIVFAMEEARNNKMNVSYHRSIAEDTEDHLHEKASHINLCHHSDEGAVASYLLKDGKRIVALVTAESHEKNAQAIGEGGNFEKVISFISPLFALTKKSNKTVMQTFQSAFHTSLLQLVGPGFFGKKAVVAVSLFLFLALFFPVKYKVKQAAVVESDNKYTVSSPYDGFLGEINARPGDLVTKGDPLAQIKVDDLRLESRRLLNQIQQYRLEYDNAMAASNRAQAAIATSQVDQAKVQLALIEKELERATLIAPITGVVVSEDISQTLGAPIKQGDVVFEVASVDEYRVVLQVKEKDIRFIQREQRGRLHLKSLPDKHIDIAVEKITPISTIQDSQNVFLVEAQLLSENLDEIGGMLRPGMTGSSDIDINRRMLGWILFHDIWYWIRLQLWF